jgi:hypothetical protein
MSAFLHQIFYASNKFGNIQLLCEELQKWAIPEPIYVVMQQQSTDATSQPIHVVSTKNSVSAPTPTRNKEQYSLFNCVFILARGYAEYMMAGNRMANREIEEKNKMVELFSKTPKKLKNGTMQLTNDNVQEILSGLYSSSNSDIMHLVAYSIYYNITIYLVFMHSYLVFSPTKDESPVEVESILDNSGAKVERKKNTETLDDSVCVIYQTRKHPKYGGSYYPEWNVTPEVLDKIRTTKIHLEHYAKPFKGISAYKLADLENMALSIGVLERTTPDGVSAKLNKKELYDKIVELGCTGLCK